MRSGVHPGSALAAQVLAFDAGPTPMRMASMPNGTPRPGMTGRCSKHRAPLPATLRCQRVQAMEEDGLVPGNHAFPATEIAAADDGMS